MDTDNIDWLPDSCLGDGFRMKYVQQPDDYSGHVRCTIVRSVVPSPRTIGVLYVHGFSDYFFQAEMAAMFVRAGYAFYAVDLRKYGRSLLPGQKMFQGRDLHEYFADINAAITQMKADTISKIVLLGHSTGGLTTALYMSESPDEAVKALILNSPFLDWNLPLAARMAIPALRAAGRLFPDIPVHQKPDRGYAESLLTDFGGEWDYRRDWKPDVLPDVDAGWVRAIDIAQRQLHHADIKVPVLLMHSSTSVRKGDSRDKYSHADAILDVERIARHGRHLGGDVTEVTVPDGLHDLVLSRPSVRTLVYTDMLTWLRTIGLSPTK